MIVLQSSVSEMKRVFGGLLGKVILVVLLCVPILYGALYLWAFWDPYGAIDRMPVALVNEDAAAKTEDGTLVDVGKSLQKELLDKNTFDWALVSATEAQQGLEDGTYYLSLTIPRNFSSNLATANTDNPVPAQLHARAQMANSFLAEQIGNRVFGEVRAAAASSAASEYFDQILIGLGDSRDSIMDASDGAFALADGINQAQQGATRISDGLLNASDGAARLTTGAITLSQGLAKLDSGAGKVASGTSTLKSNSKKLYQASVAIDVGSQTLAEGANSLSEGAGSAVQAASSVRAGAVSLEEGIVGLYAGVNQLNKGISLASESVSESSQSATALKDDAEVNAELVTAMAQAIESLSGEPISSEHAELISRAQNAASAVRNESDDLQRQLSEEAPTLKKLSGVASQCDEGAKGLPTGASSLAAGSNALYEGVLKLEYGANTVSSGSSTLAQGTHSLTQGVDAFQAGVVALNTGAAKIANNFSPAVEGAMRLKEGASELAGGISKLSAGSQALKTGLKPAVSGSKDLAVGLRSGVKEIPHYTQNKRTANADMMGNPVEMETTQIGQTENYGTGFAPYFLPLALWVGCLVGYLMLRPLPAIEDKKKTWMTSFTRTLAGFMPMATLVVLQCVVLVGVVELGLGLKPVHNSAFWLVLLGSGLTFAAILQFLNAAFGPAGKFAAIVLLMLQLTSAAGTFPIELLNPFFQALHPFMPMSYIVGALRAAISGGSLSHVYGNLEVIALFGLGAFILTVAAARGPIADSAERLSEKVGI